MNIYSIVKIKGYKVSWDYFDSEDLKRVKDNSFISITFGNEYTEIREKYSCFDVIKYLHTSGQLLTVIVINDPNSDLQIPIIEWNKGLEESDIMITKSKKHEFINIFVKFSLEERMYFVGNKLSHTPQSVSNFF